MALTTRILPREEWPRLAGTELGETCEKLDPSQTLIVVVEDEGGAIVGCWALMYVLHAEGVWVAPAHRKRGAVARRLLRAALVTARGLGAKTVTTGALTPEVERLLTHGLHAVPWPGTQYSFPIGGS